MESSGSSTCKDLLLMEPSSRSVCHLSSIFDGPILKIIIQMLLNLVPALRQDSAILQRHRPQLPLELLRRDLCRFLSNFPCYALHSKYIIRNMLESHLNGVGGRFIVYQCSGGHHLLCIPNYK